MPGLLIAPIAALPLLAREVTLAAQRRLALGAMSGAMTLPLNAASPVAGRA
jgi:hypothetical protein